MRYKALACDYDGTIATHGHVADATLDALARLRVSGRKLILVTGRERHELQTVFPKLSLFDRAVLENGAVLLDPSTGRESILADAPPAALISELQRRDVKPISVGSVIVATLEIHEATVLDVIRALDLRLQVIRNKESLMVLPVGTGKATGLQCVLKEMGLEADEVVGVGDAENDATFLSICGCSASVANALPEIRAETHIVTESDNGRGVMELIQWIIDESVELGRHRE